MDDKREDKEIIGLLLRIAEQLDEISDKLDRIAPPRAAKSLVSTIEP